jgi:hypothetical protein
MEALRISEISAKQPASARCHHPEAGSTLTVNVYLVVLNRRISEGLADII